MPAAAGPAGDQRRARCRHLREGSWPAHAGAGCRWRPECRSHPPSSTILGVRTGGLLPSPNRSRAWPATNSASWAALCPLEAYSPRYAVRDEVLQLLAWIEHREGQLTRFVGGHQLGGRRPAAGWSGLFRGHQPPRLPCPCPTDQGSRCRRRAPGYASAMLPRTGLVVRRKPRQCRQDAYGRRVRGCTGAGRHRARLVPVRHCPDPGVADNDGRAKWPMVLSMVRARPGRFAPSVVARRRSSESAGSAMCSSILVPRSDCRDIRTSDQLA